MPYPIFQTRTNVLSDGSATTDLYAHDEYGQVLIASPATTEVAAHIAVTLEEVLDKLLDCGGEQSVIALANRIRNALA